MALWRVRRACDPLCSPPSSFNLILKAKKNPLVFVAKLEVVYFCFSQEFAISGRAADEVSGSPDLLESQSDRQVSFKKTHTLSCPADYPFPIPLVGLGIAVL